MTAPSFYKNKNKLERVQLCGCTSGFKFEPFVFPVSADFLQ